MTTIQEYFKLDPFEGEVGLELELESEKEWKYIDAPNWLAKHEGSLRGHAMEFVTGRGLFNDRSKLPHIKALTDKLPVENLDIDSPRCSLHVHVNMQKKTLTETLTAMCAYWLVENLLTKFCGEHREGNLFCLRLQDAEGILKHLCADIKQRQPFVTLLSGREDLAWRYGAMNVTALQTFGSLEFRAMRCIVDPVLIDMWSSELCHLCNIGKRIATPSEFFDQVFAQPKEYIMYLLFREEFRQKLMDIRHWKDMIEENIGAVCSMAYAADWKTWEDSVSLPNALPRRRRRIPRIGDHGLEWQQIDPVQQGQLDGNADEQLDEMFRILEEQEDNQDHGDMDLPMEPEQ